MIMPPKVLDINICFLDTGKDITKSDDFLLYIKLSSVIESKTGTIYIPTTERGAISKILGINEPLLVAFIK